MNESKIGAVSFLIKQGGERLDTAAAREAGLSRRLARRLVEKGLILLNGRKAPAGRSVRAGDMLEILADTSTAAARPGLAASSGSSQLQVLYEDQWLLAVFKPRAMNSVTLRPDDPLTLADCVAAYCPQCISASTDAREAGLVQRLDFYTSGVVLAAKSERIWTVLHRAMIAGEVKKKYLALVEGRAPARALIDLSLISGAGGKKMEVCSPEKKGALAGLTEIDALRTGRLPQYSGFASLVEARAGKVHRHQIRAHLAGINHPLIGDQLYGSHFSSCPLPDLGHSLREADGFILHAAAIELCHPHTGRKLAAQASLPAIAELEKMFG